MKVNFYLINNFWINKINKEILIFINSEEELKLKYDIDNFKLKLIDFLSNKYSDNIIFDENYDYFSTKYNSEISDLFIEHRNISENLCYNFFSNQNSFNLLSFIYENISIDYNFNDIKNNVNDYENEYEEYFNYDYDIFEKFEN